MATRQQIRLQIRSIINEIDPSNSHFSDDQLNGFIDQAVMFSATFIEHPRDFIEIQAQNNIGAYNLISDNLIIRLSYFGDKNITGDVQPLTIISEETLKELVPSWLDETTTNNTGFPKYLIMLTKKQIYIHPRPDTINSTTGKKIILDYIYAPAALSDDGVQPDLPLPYHNLLQFYAAHLAYLRLSDPKMAAYMENTFKDKINALKPVVEKETKEGLAFQWGFSDNLDTTGINIVIP